MLDTTEKRMNGVEVKIDPKKLLKANDTKKKIREGKGRVFMSCGTISND